MSAVDTLLEIPMTKEKETSGTWRFKADEAGGPLPMVYIRKDAFAEGDVPKQIIVTVSRPQ